MTRLVCDQSCMHVAHLAGREETQTTPRVRHMVVFLQSGNDPCGEVHHFQQPGTVCTRTISINSRYVFQSTYLTHDSSHFTQLNQTLLTGGGGVRSNVAVSRFVLSRKATDTYLNAKSSLL